jgi:hypothetical protein
MRLLALILAIVALPLGIFAWWGTSTAKGRAKYDEMDGLYPMGAGVLAGVLIVAAILLALIARRGR